MTRKVATYTTHKADGAPALQLTAVGEGVVEAIVSVFGNVDLQGDRVVRGAFLKSLVKWQASGDPIPVIWSHQWGDPLSHIGAVTEARETDAGLLVRYKLDLDTNPRARTVFTLLKERRVREHSFAYDVLRERKGSDGANELLELEIIEVGPTLKGANPDTVLLGAKAVEAGGVVAPSLVPGAAIHRSPDADEDLVAVFLAEYKAERERERVQLARHKAAVADVERRSLALMQEPDTRLLAYDWRTGRAVFEGEAERAADQRAREQFEHEQREAERAEVPQEQPLPSLAGWGWEA